MHDEFPTQQEGFFTAVRFIQNKHAFIAAIHSCDQITDGRLNLHRLVSISITHHRRGALKSPYDVPG